jgi:lysozyme
MTRRRSRKKLTREQKAWLLLLTACLVTAGYFAFKLQWQEREERIVANTRYEAFGVQVPKGFSIHGLDVSSHQGIIHWPSVKAMRVNDIQMGYCFIKATEGLNDTDKRFKTNWQEAKEAGMLRGAYHFFLATKSGKQQAIQYMKQVALRKGDLPPVVDIEQLYKVKPALMRKRLKEWLDMAEAYYRVKPIIYTYASFYDRYLGDEFKEYPLWVAHYFEPEKPRVGRPWSFWQYSELGTINGIRTKVDCNVFNGDSTQFKQLLIR